MIDYYFILQWIVKQIVYKQSKTVLFEKHSFFIEAVILFVA